MRLKKHPPWLLLWGVGCGCGEALERWAAEPRGIWVRVGAGHVTFYGVHRWTQDGECGSTLGAFWSARAGFASQILVGEMKVGL